LYLNKKINFGLNIISVRIHNQLSFLFFFLVLQSYCQSYKGLYVDGFHQILGNQEREDSLFAYIDYQNFNSIALYNLHNLDFSSTQQMNDLRNFISDAKNSHNVTEITAVAENAWFFENKIVPYNQSSSTNEKFSVFNLEFEFWVPSAVSGYYCTSYLQGAGLNCDENGAFQFYMQELEAIKVLATQNNAITEVYLGWFNQEQVDQIKLFADRILLSNYQTNPQNCFDVSLQRFQYLGNTSPAIQVAGLFSSESDFLGPWLNSNEEALDSVYSIYSSEYYFANGSWKSNIDLVGQQWFTYSTMNNEIPSLGTIEFIEPKISLYPNPTSDRLTIEAFSPIESLEIKDLNGKSLVSVENLYSDQVNIDLSSFFSGVYVIELVTATEKNSKLLYKN
jgi:hypothetical protein